jgi:hypothetical protein
VRSPPLVGVTTWRKDKDWASDAEDGVAADADGCPVNGNARTAIAAVATATGAAKDHEKSRTGTIGEASAVLLELWGHRVQLPWWANEMNRDLLTAGILDEKGEPPDRRASGQVLVDMAMFWRHS